MSKLFVALIALALFVPLSLRSETASAAPPGVDPCANPLANNMCAVAPPSGSACRAIGLAARGPLAQTLGQSIASTPLLGPVAHQEAAFQQQAVGGTAAKEIHSVCDSSFSPFPSDACGTADATQVHLLVSVVDLTADVLRSDGCSMNGGGGAVTSVITNLRGTILGTPLSLPLAVPPNTVVNFGAGFLVLNERFSSAGDCYRETGAALHLGLNINNLEVYVGWVSTVACKLPATIASTSTPQGIGQAPGVVARDAATIAGPAGQPSPAGSLSFFLCNPAQTQIGVGCVGPAGAFVSTNPIVAGAALSATNGNTLAGGRYCWRVEYAGSPFYLAATHTNAVSECFKVKFIPAIATTNILVDGRTLLVRDQAIVAGPAGEPVPTGTVIFFLCSPSQTTPGTGCLTGTQVGAVKALSGGSAVSDADQNSNRAVGTWCWRAVYSGDIEYRAGTHTNFASECFLIKATPGITTTSDPTCNGCTGDVTANDRATLTGVAPFPLPTGQVRFFLCGPDPNFTMTGCFAGGTLISTNTLVNGVATSASTTQGATGKYCWRAEYLGDANYNAVTHTNGTTECFTAGHF